jgi:hypothetical protein
MLPAIGEGFRHLGLARMAWFAAAHTLFFVLLAVLYARWRRIGDSAAVSGRQKCAIARFPNRRLTAVT